MTGQRRMTRQPQPAGETADRSILRSSALMASGTVISRLTGVLRDISLTAALGYGILADTYALGNALPNIVYILVVGGALNAVFVPQLVRHLHEDDDGGKDYSDRLLTVTAIVLLLVSVLAVVSAPWIVRLYATGTYDAAQFDLTVAFARFCLPQIFFYGIYTMLSQVLNARMRFGPPMFAPIVNNLVMIVTALGFVWLVGTTITVGTITTTQTTVLGIATTVGIAAQAVVLLPFLRRAGYRWRLRFGFRGYGLGKAGSLAGWTIGLVLVNQLGYLVTTKLATAANVLAAETGGTPEGLATYQRAYLVFMLPHSVITISLVTALLPRMSRSAALGELREVAAQVSTGVRLVAVLIVPAAAFLAVFGPTIGTFLFDFGAGKGQAATYTGVVVSAFAFGLLPFSVFYVLLRGWYAIENTRNPFLITVLYNVIAIPLTIGGYALAPTHWKVATLALAYGLSYWIVLVVAWVWLSRRLGGLSTAHTTLIVARILGATMIAAVIATVAAAAATYGLASATHRDSDWPASADYPQSILALVVGAVVFALTYLATARLLHLKEINEVTASLLGRRRIEPVESSRGQSEGS